MIHTSVLLHELIEGLAITDGDCILDCTLGNGGHSEAVLSSGKDIRVIAFDLDPDAISRSRVRLATFASKITFVNEGFQNLSHALDHLSVDKVSKVLFDFGLSSNQLEESGRGFSFLRDEPLLMTFGHKAELSARDVVNDWSEESLREIIRGFGEERFANRIARSIVEARSEKPIETTFELRTIILGATPTFYHRGRIDPATRTFQAIRIAVNSELTAIEVGLKQAWEHLAPKGRIAAISFHSLEDRIVKHYFRSLGESLEGEILTKKPIIPSGSEMKANPRSRSAKLRIISKK
jgi:16S rRNA (cytosine1402-N4)-methyltransferase